MLLRVLQFGTTQKILLNQVKKKISWNQGVTKTKPEKHKGFFQLPNSIMMWRQNSMDSYKNSAPPPSTNHFRNLDRSLGLSVVFFVRYLKKEAVKKLQNTPCIVHSRKSSCNEMWLPHHKWILLEIGSKKTLHLLMSFFRYHNLHLDIKRCVIDRKKISKFFLPIFCKRKKKSCAANNISSGYYYIQVLNRIIIHSMMTNEKYIE